MFPDVAIKIYKVVFKKMLPGVAKWQDVFKIIGSEVDLKNGAGYILYQNVSGNKNKKTFTCM